MATDNRWWEEWKAPGVLLAALGLVFIVVSWQLSSINERIGSIEGREDTTAANMRDVGAKVDRRAEAVESRVSETNSRVDRILEGQTAAAEQVARLQSDVTYVRDRVDQIAERLEASAPPTRASPAMVSIDEAIDALRQAGMGVYDARQLQGVTVPALQQGIADREIFVVTPEWDIQQQFRDVGVEPVTDDAMANQPENDDSGPPIAPAPLGDPG